MDKDNNFVTLVIHAIENVKIGKVIVNDTIVPLDWCDCKGLSDCRVTRRSEPSDV